VEADPGNNELVRELKDKQKELAGTRAQVSTLNAFHTNIVKYWSKVQDRVIGYVVWAPKIDVNVPPYGYTRDFCVIHLNKKKFKNGFLGNTLSLGVYAVLWCVCLLFDSLVFGQVLRSCLITSRNSCMTTSMCPPSRNTLSKVWPNSEAC